MNYQKIYDNIISTAVSANRKKLKRNSQNYVYYEKHHINPRCLGGTDAKSNLVLLTAKEHYIAHQLLVKIYPKNRKLILAAYRMTHTSLGQKRTNSFYSWLKVRLAELQSVRMQGKNNPMFGKQSPNRNKTYEELFGDNAEEQRNFRRRVWSDEEKARHSINTAGIPKRRVKCPHCGTIGGSNNMYKWHFDKCKMHPDFSSESRKILICPHCQKQGMPSNMRRWHLDNCKKATPQL